MAQPFFCSFANGSGGSRREVGRSLQGCGQVERRLYHLLVIEQLGLERWHICAQRQAGGEGAQQVGIAQQPCPHFELPEQLFERRGADTELVDDLRAADLRRLFEGDQVPQQRKRAASRAIAIQAHRLFSRGDRGHDEVARGCAVTQVGPLVVDAVLLQAGDTRRPLCESRQHALLREVGWVRLGAHLFGGRDELEAKVQSDEKRFEAPEEPHLLLFGEIAHVAPLYLEDHPVAPADPSSFAARLAIAHDPRLKRVELDPRCLHGGRVPFAFSGLQLFGGLPGGVPGDGQKAHVQVEPVQQRLVLYLLVHQQEHQDGQERADRNARRQGKGGGQREDTHTRSNVAEQLWKRHAPDLLFECKEVRWHLFQQRILFLHSPANGTYSPARVRKRSWEMCAVPLSPSLYTARSSLLYARNMPAGRPGPAISPCRRD